MRPDDPFYTAKHDHRNQLTLLNGSGDVTLERLGDNKYAIAIINENGTVMVELESTGPIRGTITDLD